MARRGTGLPLGWTDDVASLMAAADVLVDNAGGLTCWEALTCGLPVVLFRSLPGHGRLNAQALEAARLAAFARREETLLPLIGSLCEASPRRAAQLASAAALHGDPLQPVLDLSRAAVAGGVR